MKLEEIEKIAMNYLRLLEPYCERVRIAGSIRRRKAECNDIELVCVRYDDERERSKFVAIVNRWEKVKGEPEGRYTQRILPEGIKLDLFMANKDNWGNIFLIRTGNWVFSRFMMGIRAKQVGLIHREGYLWSQGYDEKYPCYEEEDVFHYLCMDYVKPEDREWE